jgi:hypothetical protein
VLFLSAMIGAVLLGRRDKAPVGVDAVVEREKIEA